MRVLLCALLLLAVAAPAAHAGAPQPLIDFYAGSGGFSQEERLTVFPDRRARVAVGTQPVERVRLPRAAVRQMRTLLDRLPFRRLRDYYGPPCCTDLPTYDITYRGRTVRAEAGVGPPRLRALISQFLSVIDEARAPFLVRVTVHDDEPLQVTVRRDRMAIVSRVGEEPSRKLTRGCMAIVRERTRLFRPSLARPGEIVLRDDREPPPTVVITRAYSTFHQRISRLRQNGGAALLKVARTIAADRCR